MSPEPEMFVLDTNVLSSLAHKRPNPNVIAWILSTTSAVSIPFSALIEIERGIQNLAGRNPLRQRQLAEWLESLLASDMPVLGMDAEIARQFAKMTMVPALHDLWMTNPMAKKPHLGQDLAIAATAIVVEAPIATLNIKDFVRIHRYFPLPGVFDPASRTWVVEFFKRKSAQRSASFTA